MAEIQESGGGRKKTFEPNLIPFIDLMSVLITFLLITAVWTQVSMIQIGTSIYGKRDADSRPELTDQVEVPLKLEIRAQSYTLTLGKEVIQIPNQGGAYDDKALLAQLQRAKQLYPNKVDGALAMADDLPYERLIRAMDLFLQTGFPRLSILTGSPN
jgi:biopolymer transport protein ExbD